MQNLKKKMLSKPLLFQLLFVKVWTKLGTVIYFMVTEPFSLTAQHATYQVSSRAKQETKFQKGNK